MNVTELTTGDFMHARRAEALAESNRLRSLALLAAIQRDEADEELAPLIEPRLNILPIAVGTCEHCIDGPLELLDLIAGTTTQWARRTRCLACGTTGRLALLLTTHTHPGTIADRRARAAASLYTDETATA